jgi:hypothetical protein
VTLTLLAEDGTPLAVFRSEDYPGGDKGAFRAATTRARRVVCPGYRGEGRACFLIGDSEDWKPRHYRPEYARQDLDRPFRYVEPGEVPPLGSPPLPERAKRPGRAQMDLPDALREALHAHATAVGKSQATVVRLALAEYLERQIG